MSIVVPPTGKDLTDIELKDYYIDEQGHERERVKKVVLPKFDIKEDDSFDIFEE